MSRVSKGVLLVGLISVLLLGLAGCEKKTAPTPEGVASSAMPADAKAAPKSLTLPAGQGFVPIGWSGDDRFFAWRDTEPKGADFAVSLYVVSVGSNHPSEPGHGQIVVTTDELRRADPALTPAQALDLAVRRVNEKAVPLLTHLGFKDPLTTGSKVFDEAPLTGYKLGDLPAMLKKGASLAGGGRPALIFGTVERRAIAKESLGPDGCTRESALDLKVALDYDEGMTTVPNSLVGGSVFRRGTDDYRIPRAFIAPGGNAIAAFIEVYSSEACAGRAKPGLVATFGAAAAIKPAARPNMSGLLRSASPAKTPAGVKQLKTTPPAPAPKK